MNSDATPGRPVEHCDSMVDVRRHIDALDERIVALMAERSGYVAQAARLKSEAAQIVDPARIEFIIQRVRQVANAGGMSEAVVEATYRAMIGAFIEFERAEFKRLRQPDAPCPKPELPA